MSLRDFLVRLHLWYAGRGWTRSAKLLARLHPRITALTVDGDCWRLETTTDTYFISDPSQLVRIVGFGVDMEHRVFPKYTYPDFAAVEESDTVVDVGAFIGEFSMRAAERADRLVAIEPDKRNAAALRRNLEQFETADIVNKAVWNKSGTLQFNVAGDPSEGSILGVDTGISNTISLDAVSVADIAEEFDLKQIDFLKVEAEGAEPEVLEGIENIDVRTIAVECSPERHGKPPTDDVLAWLSGHGYTIRMRDNVVFGTQQT